MADSQDNQDQDYQLQFPDNQQDQTSRDQVNEPFESVATGFLKNVAEQDRAIVEKYVKEWDGNVSKRFQELHTKYEPYKNMGDLEQLQTALQLKAIIDNDPVEFFHRFKAGLLTLKEQGMLEDLDLSDNDQSAEPPVKETPGSQTFNNDPALMTRLEQMEQMIQGLQGNFQQDIQSRQDAQEMAQLDNVMADLHNRHGKFDDDYVLLQLSKGLDPEEAVAKYQDAIGNQSRRVPPKVFSGTGSVPSGQVDPSKMSSKDTRAYIASMFANQD